MLAWGQGRRPSSYQWQARGQAEAAPVTDVSTSLISRKHGRTHAARRIIVFLEIGREDRIHLTAHDLARAAE